MKLKWAFGYPTGVSANAQPTIASGRVFVGSDNGFVYSLDAATGCVYWSFENGSIVRNALTIGPVQRPGRSARYAVYFGDGKANVFALDAQTGRLLWKTKADPHFIARITGRRQVLQRKAVRSGLLVGRIQQRQPRTIRAARRGAASSRSTRTRASRSGRPGSSPRNRSRTRRMANGVTLYKPAGGAVWNSPTVDPVRQAVYFGTGDATTAPSPKTTDAIMAVDINTGKLLWSYQATENDVFMGGCNGAVRSEACPNPLGPDMDIGNSPILKTLPNGKRVLIAGTKSADVFALDPDNNGALLYRINPTGAPINGGRGGRGAHRVGRRRRRSARVLRSRRGRARSRSTGDRRTGLALYAACAGRRRSGRSLGAAPTAIPGVVFEGASDGKLYARVRGRRHAAVGIQHGPGVRDRQQSPRPWRRHQHLRRGRRGAHGLCRIGLRGRQRRHGGKRAAGVRHRLSAHRAIGGPSLDRMRKCRS